jgi:cyclopropane fatty-acyl-phospholipid synthase-like methyltransferase
MPDKGGETIRDFYTRYYKATRTSAVYSKFCKRVFGLYFSQHGFSDMSQVASLLAFINLKPGDRVLDLGCGNGAMADYIAELTGAHLTGIDYIPEAIRQANQRTRGRGKNLAFKVMDIGALNFPPESFDTIISIDSLYFTDIVSTIRQMKNILKPGGQMGIFYSHGVSPGNPAETFDFTSLHPDRTPLAVALWKNRLSYKTWDFTAEDYAHALLKQKVAEDMKAEFEAEGNLFLFRSRYREARGVINAIDADAHKRYLYHVTH